MRKDFYWVTPETRLFMQRGYLKPDQSVEERVKEISDTFSSYTSKELGDKFYEYMAKGYYSLSSPVWSNYGNERGLPISCFGSCPDDSMESILYTVGEVGMLSKFGGGTSGYFGHLRPRGAPITGNGESFGAVHFMELFEKLSTVVSQGSVRRGHFSPYLDIEHDDFDEFVGIGSDGHSIQQINHGVCVGDEFLKKVESGDKEARRRWAKVIENRKETGLPYIFFKDTVNNNTVDVYKEKGQKILASNMCVTGETLILTSKGHQKIQDCVGETVNVWNGSEWSEVTPKKTGENQKTLTVSLDGGQEVTCTLYHKFYLQDGTQVEAKDLKAGDKLLRCEYPIVQHSKRLKNPYIQGFYSGDGCFVKGNNKPRIYLYHDKQDLLGNFNIPQEKLTVQPRQKRTYFYVDTSIDHYEKDYVPFDVCVEDRLAWFAGLLDSDGTVHKVKNSNGTYSGGLTFTSTNKGFVKNVQLMLQTLGVVSKFAKIKEEGFSDFNDGYGKYPTKSVYRLTLSSVNSYKLYDLGMRTHRLNFLNVVQRPTRNAERFPVVANVVDNTKLYDTYCFNEPKRHMGVFNGILTGQCSEITLPSSPSETFVCVLSSMNILHYDEWKDTDAVKVLTWFLDSIVTEAIDKIKTMDSEKQHFMLRVLKFLERHRALGLGVLGWHTYLQSKLIPFESREAAKLNLEIFKYIRYQSLLASQEMAKTLGEPEILRGYGRRNTTLLAVAPTKSSSFILGQMSQGIEPEFSNYYVKDLAKVKFTFKNPYLVEVLKAHDKDTPEVWSSIKQRDGSVQHLEFLTQEEKDVFKTIYEINPETLISQAATRQSYICQSQSLNIMIDPNTPAKEINKLYMDAWKMGVKTLYYQYSLNAAQSLSRKKYMKTECVACEG